MTGRKPLNPSGALRISALQPCDLQPYICHTKSSPLSRERSMGLKEYQRKRDFTRTPEPKGSDPQKPGNDYLIQKHAARQLHYDFRLELDGVLLSWAVPKGPSLDPGERRLAVHVEDHPLEYGTFEGTIPAGEYGGGTVLLWDRGTWEPEGDPHEGLRRGDFKFQLHGEKLRGRWVLVRMGKQSARENAKENWLLIKHSDSEASPLAERDILLERPESVVSGRGMDQIASAQGAEWKNGGAVPPHQPQPVPGARKAELPLKVRPQLATLVSRIPEGDNWLHEIKFDGYRALCRIENGQASFFTREGHNWTDKFGRLPEEAARLPVQSAILDGEVVVLLPNGSTSFQALQASLGKGGGALVFFAFDLLYLNGFDLRDSPLAPRKEALAAILQGRSEAIRFSDHILGSGKELFERAAEYSLEGIISKRADRPYVSGRSTDWLKIKCLNSQEFLVGGFTNPSGTRQGFGALLVGTLDDGILIYRGKVGTGYSDKALAELRLRLDSLLRPESPFSNMPKEISPRGVHWVNPELTIQVKFAAWTRDGLLRHPSFLGLREDKDPQDVHFENKPVAPIVRRGIGANKQNHEVAGVKITNPDKVLYPEAGITKIELARYYEAIAEWAMPRIAQRPLMLLRSPEGIGKKGFYQKHASDSVPDSILRIRLNEQGDEEAGIAINSVAGLISLAQMDTLEIHAWGCRIDQMDNPDLMILDLDPDPAVPWKQVVAAAHEIRALLQSIGLTPFVKTTGGKGLHIETPWIRKATWDEMKTFSKQIAETLSKEYPDRYIAVMSKVRRQGKIFVDYLRNGRGATAICPFSTRARPGAPVAMPIEWDELTPDLRPDQFTIRNLPKFTNGIKPGK